VEILRRNLPHLWRRRVIVPFIGIKVIDVVIAGLPTRVTLHSKTYENIFAEFGRSIVATLFFALVLCGLYPLIVFGAGNCCFPHQANAVCSWTNPARCAARPCSRQNFTGAQYFHPRPSAAGCERLRTDSSAAATSARPRRNLVANITAISPPTVPTTSGDECARSRRCRDGLRQRPGPAHQRGPTQKSRLRASPRARGLAEDRVRELVKQNNQRT